MARVPAPKLDLAARVRKQDAEKDFKYYNVKRFILHPGQWTQLDLLGLTLNWNKLQFSAANATRVPNDQSGVYSFVVEPGIADHPSAKYLMYIGKVERQTFRERFRQYLREPEQRKRREHIAQMIEKWPNNLWFYYAAVPQIAMIDRLEEELLSAFIPPHNHDFPAEISATIRRVFE